MTRRERRRTTLLGAGALTLVLGTSATYAVANLDSGAAAQSAPKANDAADTTGGAVAEATATTRDLVERVTQAGTIGYGDSSPLRTNANGTLTRTSDVGTVLQRGDMPFSADGRDVELFYGTIPFWRDLASGDTGYDVAQLEENLVALGHATAEELGGDGKFDSATVRAVKRWQKAHGVEQTGAFRRADVVLASGAIRVARRAVEPGANLGPAATVLEYTGTSRLVTVKLDVSRQSLVKVGDAVQIDIPGGGTTAGKIATIGRVAADDSNGQGSPKIAVTITLDDPKAGANLDQAPVTVKLTKATAKNVLAVPVQALLALAEGGYGVEVITDAGTTLTKVEVGSFADGWVEIRGAVKAGDRVVVSS